MRSIRSARSRAGHAGRAAATCDAVSDRARRAGRRRQARRTDVARRRRPGATPRRDTQGGTCRDARPDGHRCARRRGRAGDPAARPPGRSPTRPTRPRSGSGERRSPTTPRARSSEGRRRRRLVEADAAAAIADLIGDIEQVPSSVSAVKVDGKRSYARVRAGEDVELKPRPVTVSRLRRRSRAPAVRRQCSTSTSTCTCSTGTYVRAIARDLGAGTGRRRSPHRVAAHPGRARSSSSSARTLDDLEQSFAVLARGRRSAPPSRRGP